MNARKIEKYPKISIIAALSKGVRAMGFQNKLLWKILAIIAGLALVASSVAVPFLYAI